MEQLRRCKEFLKQQG
jgi:hypothetical protein